MSGSYSRGSTTLSFAAALMAVALSAPPAAATQAVSAVRAVANTAASSGATVAPEATASVQRREMTRRAAATAGMITIASTLSGIDRPRVG